MMRLGVPGSTRGIVLGILGCHTQDESPTLGKDDTQKQTTPADTATIDPTPTVPPASATVLDHVTLVNANGVQSDRALILDGGSIVAVVAAGGEWGAATVVDGTGRYVVPGLVDAHVHLAHSGATVWTGDSLDANLRASLYHGVLAAYDVGGPDILLGLRDAIAAGDTIGPRLKVTGPFLTAPGSHPCETWPDPDLCLFVDQDNAAAVAGERVQAGADGIKVAIADAAFTPWGTPRMDVTLLPDIVAAGVPVLAHVDTDTDVLDAMQGGVSILAHPPFAAPIGEEARAAAVTAVGIHSTIGAFAAVGSLLDGSFDLDRTDLIVGPGVLENWRYVREHPEVLLDGWAEASEEWAGNSGANLAVLGNTGGVVLPGSDAGYYFVPHGLGLHAELAALQGLGWSPIEVLTLATLTARRSLGFPGGLIESGAPADLLILNADPSLDVAALGDIESIVLRGVVYPRESLRTVDLSTAPTPCLDAADCAEGTVCDPFDHACVPACTPAYDLYGSCEADSWCMPADGLDSTAGACHVEPACDLYQQDCSPDYYGQACVPYDHDTNGCWYGGPRVAGETCSWDNAELACAPGLFCSWIDSHCYTLCDPDGTDTCLRPTQCVEVEAAPGVPWFGLCL